MPLPMSGELRPQPDDEQSSADEISPRSSTGSSTGSRESSAHPAPVTRTRHGNSSVRRFIEKAPGAWAAHPAARATLVAHGGGGREERALAGRTRPPERTRR